MPSKRSGSEFRRIVIVKKLNKAARILGRIQSDCHGQNRGRISLALVEKAIRFVIAENSDAFCVFLEEMETGVPTNKTTYLPRLAPVTDLTKEERLHDARDRVDFLKSLDMATAVVSRIKSRIPHRAAERVSLLLIKDVLLFITARRLDSFRANAIST
jgi:hypothetical protein